METNGIENLQRAPENGSLRTPNNNGRKKSKFPVMPYLLISPFLISFLIFFAFPAVYSLILSFYNYRGYGSANFVGFDNYVALLTYPTFWTAVWNTIFYLIVHTVPVMVLAFILALILSNKFMKKVQRFYKPIIFLPQVTAIVAASMIWRVILSGRDGVLNHLLGTKIQFIEDPRFMKWSVVLLIVWRATSWFMVVYKVFSFSSGLLIRTFLNSVFVSVSHTVLALFISALAAFGFAKFKFPGQNLIFASLLAMMMVPVELSIAPQYILFSKIRWLNSYQVQIIPGIASVLGLFLLTQYIRTIPDALVESAKVDGAGTWRIFFQIILPLAKPALGALGILLFLHKWNDYLWPLIMVSKEELMPLMVIIPIINDKGAYMITPWELILTACVIGVIPLIGIFFMFQDKFMSNVTIGAVRE